MVRLTLSCYSVDMLYALHQDKQQFYIGGWREIFGSGAAAANLHYFSSMERQILSVIARA
jgi:hypothetical protein